MAASDATLGMWDSNAGTGRPLKWLRAGGLRPDVICDPAYDGSQGGLQGGVLNSSCYRSKNPLRITFLKFYLNSRLWDPGVVSGLRLISQPWGPAAMVTHPLSSLVAKNAHVPFTTSKELYVCSYRASLFWVPGLR